MLEGSEETEDRHIMVTRPHVQRRKNKEKETTLTLANLPNGGWQICDADTEGENRTFLQRGQTGHNRSVQLSAALSHSRRPELSWHLTSPNSSIHRADEKAKVGHF
mmetsp:Transcript_74029/g.119457  ORF Transcript_74029/g.119457 Transcript_74029/m.119457 type:complete len:106 (-) Transcript_74029:387-704(-)